MPLEHVPAARLIFAVILASSIAVALCSVPPAHTLYRSGRELQQNMSALASAHPAFQHDSCEQDSFIRHMTMGNSSAALSIIVTCNIHAHELVTSQLCVDLANALAQNQAFLADRWITIVYVGNGNREAVLDGSYCLRTNQRGVDPNRNFPIGFTITSGETYGGEQPMTEGFSQCLKELGEKLHPMVYLDIHSGEFSMVYYKHANDSTSDPSGPILQELRNTFCRSCRVLDVGSLGINGQAFQYMKYGMGVKYSSLLEIYGGYKATLQTEELCLAIFNPLSQAQLEYYKQKWVAAIQTYIQLVAQREGL